MSELKYNPSAIYKALDRKVVGQDAAKKALSVAMTTSYMLHLNFIDMQAPRVLLTGDTGTGKSYLVSTLKECLPHNHFKVFDGSTFTAQVWQGNIKIPSIITAIQKSIQETVDADPEVYNDLVAEINKYVVVLDEFDKMASFSESRSSKKELQDELLMFLEGQDFDVVIRQDKTTKTIKFNTKTLPIILLGAFSGIRKVDTNPVGFTKQGFRTIEQRTSREAITKNDLFDYGFTREILGRITKIVDLDPLTENLLFDILDTQLVPDYLRLFGAYDVELHIEDALLSSLASDALTHAEGARVLKEMLENILEPFLFQIEKYVGGQLVVGLESKSYFKNYRAKNDTL